MSSRWHEFAKTPISFKYERPSEQFLNQAKAKCQSTLVVDMPGLIVENTYFKSNIEGALPQVRLRAMVADQIKKALSLLQPEYGFVLFDGYRSRQTQYGLFKNFSESIRQKQPSWDETAIYAETRKYVSHPDEIQRFEIPPHNTGGAIDIGLTKNDIILNMGGEFDGLTSISDTDYFEKDFLPESGMTPRDWELAKAHRRILYHSLCNVGFTNYRHEWWHYDLGNCIWAQELGIDWIYGSMD